MSAFAVVLALSAAAAWIAAGGVTRPVRIYLRIASVLYGALAAAVAADAAPASAKDIATTLAPALLCLAAWSALRARPPVPLAAVVLAFGGICGIAAAATGAGPLAAAPQLLFALAVLPLVGRARAMRTNLYLALGAASLPAATACLYGSGTAAAIGVLLFSSAGLAGIAVALASNAFVDRRGGAKARSAIGGAH